MKKQRQKWPRTRPCLLESIGIEPDACTQKEKKRPLAAVAGKFNKRNVFKGKNRKQKEEG